MSAREGEQSTMTNTETETTKAAPDEIDSLKGTVVHFLHGGLNLDTSPAGSPLWEPCDRGRELVLTTTMIASTKDRQGKSWLEMLDDEARQLERWGHVAVARGPWPEGLDTLDPEGSAWLIERDRAYAEAARTEDPIRRQQLRSAADERFGGSPGQHSTTLMQYGARPSG